MAVESAADRAAFFNPSDFAVAATYGLQAGGNSAVNGIFDSEFAEIETLAEVAIGSSAPQFQCRSADLPAGAAEGDTLTIGTDGYTIRVIQPDGTGVTILILDKV